MSRGWIALAHGLAMVTTLGCVGEEVSDKAEDAPVVANAQALGVTAGITVGADPACIPARLPPSTAATPVTYVQTTTTLAPGLWTGQGTAANPFLVGGGEIDRFMKRLTEDAALTSATDPPLLQTGAPAPTSVRRVVHFGPGVFLTRGYVDGRAAELERMGYATEPYEWLIPEGWVLEGAGMHETTIRLSRESLPCDRPTATGPALEWGIWVLFGRTRALDVGAFSGLRNLGIDANFSALKGSLCDAAAGVRVNGAVVFGNQSFADSVYLTGIGTLGPRASDGTRQRGFEAFGVQVAGHRHNNAGPAETRYRGLAIVRSVFGGTIDPQIGVGQLSIFGVAGAAQNITADMFSTPRALSYQFAQATNASGTSDPYNAYMGCNTVEVTPGSTASGIVQAFTFFAVDGGAVERNRTRFADIGYYSDFWWQRNIVIQNNLFDETGSGVVLRTASALGFRYDAHRVIDNTIRMRPSEAGGNDGISAVRVLYTGEYFNGYPSGAATDVQARGASGLTVERNAITLTGARLPAENTSGLVFSEQDGLVVRDNEIGNLGRSTNVFAVTRAGRADRYENRIAAWSNNRTTAGATVLPEAPFGDFFVQSNGNGIWVPVSVPPSGNGPFVGSGTAGGSGAICLALYRFPTVAGATYQVTTVPTFTGDPYLVVRGTCSCSNDDAAGTYGSMCQCTATSAGTAEICASSYSSAYASWSYTVSQVGSIPSPSPSPSASQSVVTVAASSGAGGQSGSTCLQTYTFSVRAGHQYTISTCSSFSGDPYVRVSGDCTCTNDDACGLGSSCTCIPTANGTATLCASTYGSSAASWRYTITEQ